jgi:putative ABC transport system permease protein
VTVIRMIGLAELRARPLRTFLSALGIALGVALFVAVRIVNHSTVASFHESVEAATGKATLTVSAGEAGFPEAMLETIEKVTGVERAVPLVETRGFLADPQHRGETLAILGVDILREQEVRTYEAVGEEVIEDPLVFLNQPDSVVLTREFAKAHGLERGAKLDLATARGKVKLTVRGLLEPKGPATAFGGHIAIMDIDGARRTFGKEGKLDRVDVVTAENADLEAVARELERALGPGYRTERPATRSAELEDMVRSFQAMTSVFSLLALIVGLVLVANTASITVAERRREIGVLRAVGAGRRMVLALILAESAAVGIAGALAGAFLGRALASQMVGQVTEALSAQTGNQVEVARLDFGTVQILEAALLGALTALLASILPALGAARTSPLEAMKQSSRSPGRSGRTLRAVARLVNSAIGPFHAIASRLGGSVALLAHRSVLRHPQRTLANVSSLVLALALATLITTVGLSFRKTLLDWFSVVLQSDVMVSSYNRMPHYIAFAQPLHEDVGDEIRRVPGVKQEGGVAGLRLIHLNYEGLEIGLKAFDEPHPTSGYSMFDLQDRSAAEAGPELFDGAAPAAFVSSNFVLHFRKRTGDSIELVTPRGPLSLRIAGVVTDFASPVGVINVSRALYKEYWNDPLVNIFAVDAAPGTDPAVLRTEIERRWAESKNLMALLNSDMRHALNRGLDQSFQFLDAVRFSALLIALLCLFNTLMIGILERTRELGMLRAVGMTRHQMVGMVLQEAVLQGTAGSFLGAVVGIGVAYFLVNYQLAKVLGWILSFQVSWPSVVQAVALGIATALAAGIYPSIRASRLSIREALSHE